MKTQRQLQLEARAKVLKALAHPSRLLMVEELEAGERCVCDLKQLVGADMSTVSKHLSVLKNAGIVVDDKRGNQVFYRLRVPCVTGFFDCIEAVLSEQAKCSSAACGSNNETRAKAATKAPSSPRKAKDF